MGIMKKITIVILLLTFSSYGQDKWRRLNLTAGSSVNPAGQVMRKASANLFYEIDKGYSLQVWAATVSTNTSSWIGAKSVIVKKVKSFTYEAGLYYDNGNRINSINNNVYTGFKITKEFKL